MSSIWTLPVDVNCSWIVFVPRGTLSWLKVVEKTLVGAQLVPTVAVPPSRTPRMPGRPVAITLTWMVAGPEVLVAKKRTPGLSRPKQIAAEVALAPLGSRSEWLSAGRGRRTFRFLRRPARRPRAPSPRCRIRSRRWGWGSTGGCRPGREHRLGRAAVSADQARRDRVQDAVCLRCRGGEGRDGESEDERENTMRGAGHGLSP